MAFRKCFGVKFIRLVKSPHNWHPCEKHFESSHMNCVSHSTRPVTGLEFPAFNNLTKDACVHRRVWRLSECWFIHPFIHLLINQSKRHIIYLCKRSQKHFNAGSQLSPLTSIALISTPTPSRHLVHHHVRWPERKKFVPISCDVQGRLQIPLARWSTGLVHQRASWLLPDSTDCVFRDMIHIYEPNDIQYDVYKKGSNRLTHQTIAVHQLESELTILSQLRIRNDTYKGQ